MAQPTFDELTAIPDQDTVEQTELLPAIASLGGKISSWIPGDPYRTLTKAVAKMRVDVRNAIATLVLSTFEQYVFQRSQFISPRTGLPIDVSSWAPLRALDRYRVQRLPATYTKRLITLTNTSNAVYGPLKDGKIILLFGATKNRYVLDVQPSGDGTTTIPGQVAGVPGVVQAVFRSQFLTDTASGIDYSGDTSGATISFVTAGYAGVTATNPAPVFSSPVNHFGVALGAVVPSGSPTGGSHFATIYIDGTGDVAGSTVQWSTVLDNGAKTPRSGSSASLGSGITVTLTDNGGSPNFYAGEYYSFTTPGTDVVQVGADIETPTALGDRCWGLWPSLGFPQDPAGNWVPHAPTALAYKALALSVNANVRVVLVITDGTINNRVNLIIAGSGGQILPASVIANVQKFFDAYGDVTDSVAVLSPVPRVITLAGVTILCRAALIPAAQTSLTKRLGAYISGVDSSAPLGINGADGSGVVDYDYLISLIRTTIGVTRVTGTLTINAVAADLALPVTPTHFESPQLPGGFDSKTAFSWTPT